MLQSITKTMIFDGPIKQRVRICLNYENSWRPIFWLEIGKDGSVYCSHRLTSPVQELRHTKVEVPINQPYKFLYEIGELISNPELLGNIKTSFHGSGNSHVKSCFSFKSPNLRTLSTQERLAVLLFRHPSTYEAIHTVKKFDVCLDYPINLDCPITGELLIAPLNKVQPCINDADHQEIMVFEYKDLKGCPDLTLQLSLSHKVSGPWPPYNIMLTENITRPYEEAL